MGIIVLIVLVAGSIAIDVPLMWRKKLIKEMWVFSFLLLLGIFFGVIKVMHISIPNPLGWMIFIYKPVADMVNVWLT
ncbi:hypothetical protein [Paenibacillus sp. FSL R10-2734]|uniref:hypothetical protein n=1 Tax=Paenibacillus sp. FSL R10-2734 TaxID=2954691 RepID=UPI0030DC9429